MGEGVHARVLDYFPNYRHLDHWDPRKAEITIQHLLTMSSGLTNDWNGSPASEDNYQSQTAQPDWTRIVLDAELIADPGAENLYASGNPLILGAILEQALVDPVEWFAHRRLLLPLGVERFAS